MLKDVLEYEPEEFTKMSDNFLKRNGERNCMIDDTKEKAHSFSAMDYVKNGRQGNYLACDNEGKPTYNTPKKLYDIPREILKDNERQRRVYSKDGKSPTVLARSDSAKVETYNTPKQVGVAADINGHDSLKRVYSENGKSPTVNAHGGGNTEPKVAVTSYREVRTEKAKEERKRIKKETGKDHTPFRSKELIPRDDGKVGAVTPSLNKDHTISIQGGAVRGRPKGKKYIQKLETRSDDKSNALTTARKDSVVVEDELTWRKLTPLECERLQTLPDNYTEGVSNTQRYKMIGNGFTIKVIEHILGNMDL